MSRRFEAQVCTPCEVALTPLAHSRVGFYTLGFAQQFARTNGIVALLSELILDPVV
jgi:hypothetical protein